MKIITLFVLLFSTQAYSGSMTLKCFQETNGETAIELVQKNGAFEIQATAGSTVLFKLEDQRPSLNVRIDEGASNDLNEFVDISPNGLEVVPVDSPTKLEIALNQGPHLVSYRDVTKSVQVLCNVKRGTLLHFFGIKPTTLPKIPNVKAVGFDIDDTLSFTSPAFDRGFATGGLPKPDDTLFWTHVNACDKGCEAESIILPDGTTKVLPSNAASTPKILAVELVRRHLALGHRVYAITARPDIKGDALREYIESEFGIAKTDVYFEPEINLPGNPSGKTDRIEALDLDVFYGDSDSDITDTRKAFLSSYGTQKKKVEAVRFLRSPKSSNRKAGYLNKYHPGYFGEPILANSY